MHGLVLSGGGAKGAYEGGAACEVIRHHAGTASAVTVVSGTSVGALNAALLTQGFGTMSPDLACAFLKSIWRTIEQGDIMREPRLGLLGKGFRLWRGRAAYDSRPLARTVAKYIDPAVVMGSPLRLIVHATNLATKAIPIISGSLNSRR